MGPWITRWGHSMAVLLLRRTRHSLITSKLTNKFRTTIPRPVRTALDLHPGDEIEYEIGDTGARGHDSRQIGRRASSLPHGTGNPCRPLG